MDAFLVDSSGGGYIAVEVKDSTDKQLDETYFSKLLFCVGQILPVPAVKVFLECMVDESDQTAFRLYNDHTAAYI